MRKKKEQLAQEKEREYWDPLRKVCIHGCCVRMSYTSSLSVHAWLIKEVDVYSRPNRASNKRDVLRPIERFMYGLSEDITSILDANGTGVGGYVLNDTFDEVSWKYKAKTKENGGRPVCANGNEK